MGRPRGANATVTCRTSNPASFPLGGGSSTDGGTTPLREWEALAIAYEPPFVDSNGKFQDGLRTSVMFPPSTGAVMTMAYAKLRT